MIPRTSTAPWRSIPARSSSGVSCSGVTSGIPEPGWSCRRRVRVVGVLARAAGQQRPGLVAKSEDPALDARVAALAVARRELLDLGEQRLGVGLGDRGRGGRRLRRKKAMPGKLADRALRKRPDLDREIGLVAQ